MAFQNFFSKITFENPVVEILYFKIKNTMNFYDQK